jgi:hypothetical protein
MIIQKSLIPKNNMVRPMLFWSNAESVKYRIEMYSGISGLFKSGLNEKIICTSNSIIKARNVTVHIGSCVDMAV